MIGSFLALRVFPPQFHWGMTDKNGIYLGQTMWFLKGVQCINLIYVHTVQWLPLSETGSKTEFGCGQWCMSFSFQK